MGRCKDLLMDQEDTVMKEFEEAMKAEYDPCEMCPENQINTCPYIENADRKSCPIVKDYMKEGKN